MCCYVKFNLVRGCIGEKWYFNCTKKCSIFFVHFLLYFSACVIAAKLITKTNFNEFCCWSGSDPRQSPVNFLFHFILFEYRFIFSVFTRQPMHKGEFTVELLNFSLFNFERNLSEIVDVNWKPATFFHPHSFWLKILILKNLHCK